jgi:L-lysine 6-transaminase
VGEHLLRGLQELQRELGGVMSNARGRGLMIAFDLPSPELRGKAHKKIVENGLLLLTCGVQSIRFRPALNLSPADADAGLEIVRKSLKAL